MVGWRRIAPEHFGGTTHSPDNPARSAMFRSSSPRRRLAAAVTGPALAAGVAAIEHWTQDDDGVAGFPYIGFNWPICYNTDQLEKAGVTEIPSSVDDLLAVAEELRAIGSQPMALGGAEWPVTNFVAWMVEQYASRTRRASCSPRVAPAPVPAPSRAWTCLASFAKRWWRHGPDER